MNPKIKKEKVPLVFNLEAQNLSETGDFSKPKLNL